MVSLGANFAPKRWRSENIKIHLDDQTAMRYDDFSLGMDNSTSGYFPSVARRLISG